MVRGPCGVRYATVRRSSSSALMDQSPKAPRVQGSHDPRRPGFRVPRTGNPPAPRSRCPYEPKARSTQGHRSVGPCALTAPAPRSPQAKLPLPSPAPSRYSDRTVAVAPLKEERQRSCARRLASPAPFHGHGCGPWLLSASGPVTRRTGAPDAFGSSDRKLPGIYNHRPARSQVPRFCRSWELRRQSPSSPPNRRPSAP